MTTEQNQIREILQPVLKLAKELYGYNESVKIKVKNLGRCAGWAKGMNEMELNSHLLTDQYQQEFPDQLRDTIIHELAHLVCHRFPKYGRNHDAGWKRVCKALGGSGKRTHDLPLPKARKTRKYVYMASTGKTYNLGSARHKRLQTGRVIWYRNRDGQRILPEMFTGQSFKD